MRNNIVPKDYHLFIVGTVLHLYRRFVLLDLAPVS